MKKFILFLLPLLASFALLTACQKEDPIYYKITGEGYVYDKVTKEPVPFIDVAVMSCNNSTGDTNPYLSLKPDRPCIIETFSTDENGFYQVRFAKRYNGTKPIYGSSVVYVAEPAYTKDRVDFDRDFLQKQKDTFKIDTLWVAKGNY